MWSLVLKELELLSIFPHQHATRIQLSAGGGSKDAQADSEISLDSSRHLFRLLQNDLAALEE